MKNYLRAIWESDTTFKGICISLLGYLAYWIFAASCMSMTLLFFGANDMQVIFYILTFVFLVMVPIGGVIGFLMYKYEQDSTENCKPPIVLLIFHLLLIIYGLLQEISS
jgi:hypothetical protein